MTQRALSHLEDAEATLMSFISHVTSTPDDAPDEDLVDVLPVVMAVLRSVSRAAGALDQRPGQSRASRGDFGSHVDLGHSHRTGIECWSHRPEVDGSTRDLTTIPSGRAKLIAS